jgi:hypothetical protein
VRCQRECPVHCLWGERSSSGFCSLGGQCHQSLDDSFDCESCLGLAFWASIAANPEQFWGDGGRPDHPQLLDWLAAELVDGGWSLKRLHRLIMTSGVVAAVHVRWIGMCWLVWIPTVYF